MSYYNPNDYAAGAGGGSGGMYTSAGAGGGSGGMYNSNQLQFQDFSSGYGQAPQAPQQGGFAASGGGFGGAGDGFAAGGGGYEGSMFGGSMASAQQPTGYSFDDEPPLLEELEINFDQIKHKAIMALNPMKPGEAHLMDDTDLAGPLLFCLTYGGFLLLSGKMSFSYVYGVALVGSLALFALLNLMSEKGVSLTCVCSVLGYCLLPMVLLSSVAIIFSLKGTVGLVLTGLSIFWCTVSSAKMFVHVLQMQDQRLLVAYPCMLLYGVFALMTVF